MKTKPAETKELIWTTSYLIIPAIFLSKTSEIITDNSQLEVIFSGLLGGLGALIGWVGFSLVKTKNTIIKICGLLIIIGICISFFVVADQLT